MWSLATKFGGGGGTGLGRRDKVRPALEESLAAVRGDEAEHGRQDDQGKAEAEAAKDPIKRPSRRRRASSTSPSGVEATALPRRRAIILRPSP